jgi:competence protein ComGF
MREILQRLNNEIKYAEKIKEITPNSIILNLDDNCIEYKVEENKLLRINHNNNKIKVMITPISYLSLTAYDDNNRNTFEPENIIFIKWEINICGKENYILSSGVNREEIK